MHAARLHTAAMADEDIATRLRRFHTRYFPRFRRQFRALVAGGQHPRALFIGCSDSRLVPHLLTGSGPGELFVVRNVGNFVPPYDASHGHHGTAAAVEFAVLHLGVHDIIVCGHSHCGAIKALYAGPNLQTPHLDRWLDLGREAISPMGLTPEGLRQSEQRSIMLQLERLMAYPMVAERVHDGRLFLHGWHYVIEDGEVLVLDVERGEFRAADAPPDGSESNVVDLLQ
jgi:carbonic anhydrase